MKKLHFALVIILTLAVTSIVISALFFMREDRPDEQFSINGSGTIYAKADIANIEIGLRTGTKKTAADATVESTKKMNNIIKAVKDLGVEEKDIKTSNYNLNPVYNWTQAKGQELIGYEISQNVTLKVRSLDKIGDIIARTTEQGANQIGNISFTIDDEYDLKNQAREEAIKKAKEKAEIIAAQTGIKLGKIKNFYENTYQPVPSPFNYSNVKEEAANQSAPASPEIQSGQNEIKVEVTLVYEVE